MSKEQLLEKAKELIRLDSTVYNKPMLHKALAMFSEYIAQFPGITIETFESNGVPSLLAYAGASRPDEFDIILNAHIDVVPGNPQDFVPSIKNGRLYGRGAYDMKVAALVMTNVFCNNALKTPIKLGLQIVTDEEVGGYDGVCHQFSKGVRAKFCLIGEMTDLEICNQARGLCWMDIAFHGVRAHGAHAWLGINAVARATRFVHELEKRFPMPSKPAWATTVNISSISTSNSTYNLVPHDAMLKLDFRFPENQPIFASRQTIEEFIKSIDSSAEIVSMPVFEPAMNTPIDNPDLEKLIHAFTSVMGSPPNLVKRHGGSDGRHFAALNIPCVELGPIGRDHHGDKEYVEINSIKPYQDILESYLNEYTRPAQKISGN